MFKKIKTALVKSFVGAIALGWIFAQGILHFAYTFSAPVTGWLTRREYYGLVNRIPAGFSLRDALPELARAFVLLLIGYLLLRWLYFKPLENELTTLKSEQTSSER
jgi:hypothetical protein